MRSIVVAYGANLGIGYQGQLPWRLPSDMRRFRELTSGGTVLMGRKTYESLPDAFRPLPRRRNVVISANPDFDPAQTEEVLTAEAGVTEGTSVEVRRSIEAGLAACGGDCFVIGGGSIYEQVLAQCERVYATIVHASPLSDTYFPELPPEQWRLSERAADIRENGTRFHFATYDRIH
ncbi:MAG TPA: dihydrofolate reductase [Solirubrobacteraceae bacterium]|nr:dihydrofolate reductase [Solirubrobacteraceae bacterium]